MFASKYTKFRLIVSNRNVIVILKLSFTEKKKKKNLLFKSLHRCDVTQKKKNFFSKEHKKLFNSFPLSLLLSTIIGFKKKKGHATIEPRKASQKKKIKCKSNEINAIHLSLWRNPAKFTLRPLYDFPFIRIFAINWSQRLWYRRMWLIINNNFTAEKGVAHVKNFIVDLKVSKRAFSNLD